MPKIFTNSYKRAVYYKAGTMSGKEVFRRAPFDLLIIEGVPHIQPHSISVPDAAIARTTTNSGCNLQDTLHWRDDNDFGQFEVMDPLIVEEHQMGDASDTFFGHHAMSLC